MSARIEELRNKFDENPRRYFAPLANEYRKAGDIDQAIAICQEYLPLQPGHMSGHIVLGQALYEAARLDEARGVFETALSLDPENLIALRHLGDIARDSGDLDGARGWYNRVLDADPRNEEITGLLTALDQPAAAASAPAAEAPVSSSAPTPLVNPAVEFTSGESPIIERASSDALTLSDVPTVEIPRMGSLLDEPGPMAPTPAYPTAMFGEPLETAPPESPLPELDAVMLHAETAAAPPPPAREPELLDFEMPLPGIEPQREPSHEEMAASTQAERLPDLESGMPGHTLADAERDARERSVESLAGLEPTTFDEEASASTEAAAESMGVTSPVEIEESSERRTRALAGLPSLDDDEEPLEPVRTTTSGLPRDSVQMPGLEPTAVDTGETEAVSAAHGEREAGKPAARAEEPAAEAARATPSAGAMFVTETMAELYLRQGHREEAIAVYRQLVEQRPDDAELRARLEQAVGGAKAPSGPSIRDFLGAIALRRPGEGGNGNGAAHESGAEPSSPSTQPASGGSIDALFGAGAPREDEAAGRLAAAFADTGVPESAIAGAPARQATSELSLDHVFRERGGTPAQGQPTFSFDQFFSQEASEHAAGGEQGGRAAPDDDIQQFNAWLEGLKKS